MGRVVQLFRLQQTDITFVGKMLGRSISKLLVTLLVLGTVNVSVPAVASEVAASEVPSPARPVVAMAHTAALPSISNSTLRLQPGTLERSIQVEVRRLAVSAKAQIPGDTATAPQRSWAGRHPILLGTLIGLGVGLGDETVQCVAGVHVVPHSGEGLPCDARIAAAVGGLSAGIGAGVGAVVAVFLR